MGTEIEREWICYSLCTDKIRDWKISRYGDCLRTKTIVKLCEGKAFPEYTQELDVIGNDFSLLLLYARWSSWQLARLISDCGSIQKYLDELGVNSKEAKDVKKGRKKNYWNRK